MSSLAISAASRGMALCRYCTRLTHMTVTALCDRCWELESRIRRDPDLAEKILRAVREGEARS